MTPRENRKLRRVAGVFCGRFLVRLRSDRDFVHFHVDPIGFDCAIFNFADNMLVGGAIILMLLALRPEPGPSASSIGSSTAESLPIS